MNHDQDTARKIVEMLEKSAARVDTDTAGQLANARARAVNSMMGARHVAHADITAAGVMRFIHSHIHGQRAWATAAALFIAALLILIVTQDLSRAPVETDALLLASDLPPEAYADKGFHAWLENSSHSQL